MAGRKYKPALFELINTPRKGDEGGSLKTPGWFYGRTKSATEAAQKETIVNKSAGKPTATETTKRYTFTHAARLPESFLTQKVTFTASYWLIGLTALTMLTAIVGAYILGQGNPPTIVPEIPADLKNTPSAGQPDQTPLAPPNQEFSPATKTPPASPAVMLPSVTTTPPTPTADTPSAIAPAEGIVLTILTHEHVRDLQPVQAYFTRNGVNTNIGRYKGQFVLYSKETFLTRSATLRLKPKVIKLGANYNKEKPKTALGFNPDSFTGAYTLNLRDIDDF